MIKKICAIVVGLSALTVVGAKIISHNKKREDEPNNNTAPDKKEKSHIENLLDRYAEWERKYYSYANNDPTVLIPLNKIRSVLEEGLSILLNHPDEREDGQKFMLILFQKIKKHSRSVMDSSKLNEIDYILQQLSILIAEEDI